jgi:hypothetical protein
MTNEFPLDDSIALEHWSDARTALALHSADGERGVDRGRAERKSNK